MSWLASSAPPRRLPCRPRRWRWSSCLQEASLRSSNSFCLEVFLSCMRASRACPGPRQRLRRPSTKLAPAIDKACAGHRQSLRRPSRMHCVCGTCGGRPFSLHGRWPVALSIAFEFSAEPSRWQPGRCRHTYEVVAAGLRYPARRYLDLLLSSCPFKFWPVQVFLSDGMRDADTIRGMKLHEGRN